MENVRSKVSHACARQAEASNEQPCERDADDAPCHFASDEKRTFCLCNNDKPHWPANNLEHRPEADPSEYIYGCAKFCAEEKRNDDRCKRKAGYHSRSGEKDRKSTR